MTAFRLSPSTIARYFYHDCERYLRYHATPAQLRMAHGIPRPTRAPSLVTQALMARGYDWEETVLQTRLDGQVLIAPGAGPLHERVHSVADTLTALRTLPVGHAIYQPTLEVPVSFLTRYGLDPQLCDFPPCRPDLLLLEEGSAGRHFRIIDLKASDELRTSHVIQTALYALILREVLDTAGLPFQVDLQQSGIWLYEAPAPSWVALEANLRLVERFLRERLPRLLGQPLDQVAWHLCFRCEWCDFYQPCRTEAEQTRSVSLLPSLSVHGRRYLRDAPWGGPPIHTLEDLQGFLESRPPQDIDTILNACGNLRHRRTRLTNALHALQTQTVVTHGGSSLAMPINEQVQIVMTLQSDPYSGAIYAASFLRLKGKEVYGTGSQLFHSIAATPEECRKVRAEFLHALCAELHTLHDYNASRIWADQKSMQAYVFDSYEFTLFQQLLLESLDDAALAPYALQMLFYFQDEGLATQEQHPEPEVPYPVVVLTGVIRQLAALPAPLVRRLPEVLQALPAPNGSPRLTPNALFWFELGNPLKSDAIAMAWQGTHPDAITWITDELTRRLRATSAVVDGLRERVKEQLFAWPPKFRFPGTRVFQHLEYSQLAFMVRYESFMAAMAVRNARTGPWEERLQNGISVPLQYVGGSRWAVLAPLEGHLVEASEFCNRLLVPAGAQGEREHMGYNDYHYRRAMYSLPKRSLWIAAVTQVEVPDGSSQVSHLQLAIKGTHPFQPGARASLHPRFTDWNADRIVDCLATLDTQPEDAFLRLLHIPSAFATALTVPSRIQDRLQALRKTGFTPSQQQALEQLTGYRLALVWGPPGTGKTYFLARALLCLAEAYWQADIVLRVGVTAFTHAAIENLLLEITALAKHTGLGTFLRVYKLKDTYTQRGAELPVLDEGQAAALPPDEPVVLGSTVYSLRKAREAGLADVDLLIVDEASQMKFGEFALVFPSLAPQTGRLVLAGDDLQLPPIINGQYPERADGLPGLHESIFAYLRARDNQSQPYTWQLTENWRMNTTLCQFPASTLYGSQYRPATPAVAHRRLLLASPRRHALPMAELLEWVLDPAYPLVVGVLDGVQATTENRLEAEIVAHLACALRARLMQESGEPYPDSPAGDSLFWRQGLFIVSPHHTQIHAIQQALQRLRTWYVTPFVDTVDKMQGQQSQAVMVSYGVSDVETALQEAAFIYGRNRLNVALTRAQAKCMVFLPRPLLEPSLELLRDDTAAQGLGFMQALLEYCAAGQERVFDLTSFQHGGTAQLRVLRIGEGPGLQPQFG